ncbi:TraB/GumN family protein [Sphingomonas hylomeconis]|uniref:TraB/GumN family protein n=2 Tax=Sphingomonas hylomeconis TaxID=1395958 RepID=A0ABV7T0G8_9SPHN
MRFGAAGFDGQLARIAAPGHATYIRAMMMLKKLRALFAAALLALPLPAVAKGNDADPALWVVKDADTTIYLFGTIHVLKPGLTWFDDGVKTAFDASDDLVLEMIQPPAAEMQGIVLKAGFTTEGKTLPEKLAAPDRAAYLKALSGFGLPANALDRADPWLAATQLSLIPVMKSGYDTSNGPETVLSAAAKAAGKKVIGLETAEQQIGYFDTLPETLQIAFLNSTVKDLPEVNKSLAGMVDDWSAGKPERLGKTLNEGMRDTPEIGRVLLTDRNIRWADWIGTRMQQPGTVFVAVGAGHLAGKDSVIAQLKRHKLKAVRVKY